MSRRALWEYLPLSRCKHLCACAVEFKKHILSPSKSKVLNPFLDSSQPRWTFDTNFMASTSPTTSFTAKTDLTFSSLPERRRRRWGVDLETVRSLVETPGCDTKTYVSDGQSLTRCSIPFSRLWALMMFASRLFPSSLLSSACVRRNLLAAGQSYWLVE